MLAAAGLAYEAQLDWRARHHLFRGLEEHRRGAIADAIADLATAANIDSRYWRTRVQLALTLTAAFRAYFGRIHISPEAADIAFEKAASASPDMPALLLARVEYLLNSGRWRRNEREMSDLLARLQRSGKAYLATARALALYEMKRKEG